MTPDMLLPLKPVGVLEVSSSALVSELRRLVLSSEYEAHTGNHPCSPNNPERLRRAREQS